MPKKAAKQVMDVAKPGKSAPAATSRPVIVGHKSVLKDPMVNDSPDDSVEHKITVTRAKTIMPPKSTDSVASPPVKETPKANPSPDATTPSPPETPSPSTPSPEPTESPTPEDTPPPPETSDDETVNAIAEQAAKPKGSAPMTEAEKQEQAAYAKIIEQKKYYVPIGQVTHRRHTRWALIFLMLLILLVAFILAIDAEALDIGIRLPFDFISL